jgi:hypothetical protein
MGGMYCPSQITDFTISVWWGGAPCTSLPQITDYISVYVGGGGGANMYCTALAIGGADS